MTNEPSVSIRLENDGRNYQPGENLSGDYTLQALSPDEIKALEVSVLWHTLGKGDEDMAVHAFWRVEPEEGTLINIQQPAKFETVLPNSPLSYDGLIVKVRWCVRVRAFLHRGKEVLGQKNFHLGNLPSLEAQTAN